jgi:hypothetical protein
MGSDELSPRAIARRDAAALIGVLAVLTGGSMLDQLDGDLATGLTRRLVREGLLDKAAGSRELQLALSDLVERLRYALGEYETPPLPTQIEGVSETDPV